LTGEKKGKREVFIELPGFGDTIRLTDKQTLMVPLAGARASKFTSMLDLTGKVPFIRHLLGYVNIKFYKDFLDFKKESFKFNFNLIFF
jgi:hypothetical protein